ncbi:DUF411 domain-containing protein [Helicobacter pametensis]|uniref:DUF411 domain-containing protein n=1 Tax=Helicobacter pametensis TaxID=95149 RepID=UPI001F239906
MKAKYNLPRDFQSCHTGVVEGYFLEGHIPAEDIKRLLQEKPKNVIGLSVPGMPLGSPGMEQGNRKDSYRVYYFTRDGEVGVWARH